MSLTNIMDQTKREKGVKHRLGGTFCRYNKFKATCLNGKVNLSLSPAFLVTERSTVKSYICCTAQKTKDTDFLRATKKVHDNISCWVINFTFTEFMLVSAKIEVIEDICVVMLSLLMTVVIIHVANYREGALLITLTHLLRAYCQNNGPKYLI